MHLLIAYAAGVLSFLAPCGMFLLPAFFGYAFDRTNRRVSATWALLAGFSTLFIPIGLGAYALGASLALHRQAFAMIGGGFMIAAGLAVLAGRTLGGRVPHVQVAGRRDPRSLSTVYLLGVSFGFTVAGCSAPLLAITLALASMSANVLRASAILVAYVVGLGTPLLALSVAADRGRIMERFAWAQKTWSLQLPGTAGRRHEIRAADAIAALMLIVLGSTFIASQGSFYVPMLLGSRALVDLNAGAANFLSSLR